MLLEQALPSISNAPADIALQSPRSAERGAAPCVSRRGAGIVQRCSACGCPVTTTYNERSPPQMRTTVVWDHRQAARGSIAVARSSPCSWQQCAAVDCTLGSVRRVFSAIEHFVHLQFTLLVETTTETQSRSEGVQVMLGSNC